jgi:hypothetical protein
MTGSFHIGLVGLTVATAIALLLTMELASHARKAVPATA